MIDAKRLAEMMKPEKLRSVAEDLSEMGRTFAHLRAGVGIAVGASEQHLRDCDALDYAAAVLREVASAKVIEIDLDDPGECIFCDYEQGYCHADKRLGSHHRSCVQGAPEGKKAPAWCHARGRVIVKAKP